MFNDEKYGLTDAVLSGVKTQTRRIVYPSKSHPNKSFQDLTGMRFGRLIVICQDHVDAYRKIYWKCQCDCGNIAIVRGNALKSGNTQSCGCLKHEIRNVKHGMTNSRLYNIWSKIKSRCYVKTDPAYRRYGFRGISMCEDWKDNFIAFFEWAIYNGYSDELSIDRIDVNGNYEPSNCRWSTPKEQSNNRRSNIPITINGITLNLQEWCNKLNINRNTVNTRVRICGWSYETALTTPVRKHNECKSRRQHKSNDTD